MFCNSHITFPQGQKPVTVVCFFVLISFYISHKCLKEALLCTFQSSVQMLKCNYAWWWKKSGPQSALTKYLTFVQYICVCI